MKRLLLLLLALPALAEFTGSNLTSVSITASGASLIPTYFTHNVAGFPFSTTSNVSGNGASTQSAVITNIQGINYDHMLVQNNTAYPIGLIMTTQAITSPSTNANRILYVTSNGYAAWDGLPVQNFIYLESTNGQSVTAGNVNIMVWGDQYIAH